MLQGKRRERRLRGKYGRKKGKRPPSAVHSSADDGGDDDDDGSDADGGKDERPRKQAQQTLPLRYVRRIILFVLLRFTEFVNLEVEFFCSEKHAQKNERWDAAGVKYPGMQKIHCKNMLYCPSARWSTNNRRQLCNFLIL